MSTQRTLLAASPIAQKKEAPRSTGVEASVIRGAASQNAMQTGATRESYTRDHVFIDHNIMIDHIPASDTAEFPMPSKRPSKPLEPDEALVDIVEDNMSTRARPCKPDRRRYTRRSLAYYPGVPWEAFQGDNPWLAWSEIEKHLMGWGIPYAVIKIVHAWASESVFQYSDWGREQVVRLDHEQMRAYSISAVTLHQTMLRAAHQGVIDLVDYHPGGPRRPAEYFIRLRTFVEEEQEPELSQEEIREAELAERGEMMVFPEEEELAAAVAAIEAELIKPVVKETLRRQTGPLAPPQTGSVNPRKEEVPFKETLSNPHKGNGISEKPARSYEIPSNLPKHTLSREGMMGDTLKETLSKLDQKRQSDGFLKKTLRRREAAHEADSTAMTGTLKVSLSTPPIDNRFDHHIQNNITSNTDQIESISIGPPPEKQNNETERDLRMLMRDAYIGLQLSFDECVDDEQHVAAIEEWMQAAKQNSRFHSVPIDQLLEALAAKLPDVQKRREKIEKQKRRGYWFKCAVNLVKEIAAKTVAAVAVM